MSGAAEYSLTTTTTTTRAHACKRAGVFGDNLSCNARDVSRAAPAQLPADACTAPTDMDERYVDGETLGTYISACFSTPLHEHNMAPAAATSSAPNSQRSWRSFSDQNMRTHNVALHRALASLKKGPQQVPDAVKKQQKRPPLGHVRGSHSFSAEHRNIATGTDARTLSMRERGRWGNSKMQQQLVAGSCGSIGTVEAHMQNPNLSSHEQPQPPLQHVQCLQCGSFSTTPLAGNGAGGGATGVKGAGSHSFGRRTRDYSCQQELLQEQKKPLGQQQHQQVKELHSVACPASERNAIRHHNHCGRDFYPPYAPGGAPAGAAPITAPFKLHHGTSPMTWQERYMLLCQAIAAGAFVDGLKDSAEEFSGPLQPRPAGAGYSWAECECPACEASDVGENDRGGSTAFGRPHNSTSTGERMMELDAFSGPLGYVSESQLGMTELSSLKEKLGRRGASRWWARLPSFGKMKSSSSSAAPPMRGAGQTTAQCRACAQHVWAAKGSSTEEVDQVGRLCLKCMMAERGGGSTEAGPTPPAVPPPPKAARPAAAAGRHSFNQRPSFSNSAFHQHQHHYQKHLPRRWRLMKLCRYLMGFPMRR